MNRHKLIATVITFVGIVFMIHGACTLLAVYMKIHC